VGLCWGGLLLFVISLLLPAIRVQGKSEWIAGDRGYVCLFLSLAEFPCWVPHALLITGLFVGTFAGKTAKKASGVVLALTTLTVLSVEEFADGGIAVLGGSGAFPRARVTALCLLAGEGSTPGTSVRALFGMTVKRLFRLEAAEFFEPRSGDRGSDRNPTTTWATAHCGNRPTRRPVSHAVPEESIA